MDISMKRLDDTTIAQRAHSLWDRRGRPFGSPDTDWYEAIRELSFERAAAAAESMDLPFSDCRMEAEEV